MAMTMHPSLAVHPGDWLKSEVVDPHGVSIKRLAASFHVTRQTLSNLFNGHNGRLSEQHRPEHGSKTQPTASQSLVPEP